MKNTINNELDKLEKIYFEINSQCNDFDYDCNRCPYKKMCDLLGDIIISYADKNRDEEK